MSNIPEAGVVHPFLDRSILAMLRPASSKICSEKTLSRSLNWCDSFFFRESAWKLESKIAHLLKQMRNETF